MNNKNNFESSTSTLWEQQKDILVIENLPKTGGVVQEYLTNKIFWTNEIGATLAVYGIVLHMLHKLLVYQQH